MQLVFNQGRNTLLAGRKEDSGKHSQVETKQLYYVCWKNGFELAKKSSKVKANRSNKNPFGITQ